MRERRFLHAGWEDSDWSGEFRFGSSVQASCRDLARAAQLLLNDGFWPGAGQLVDRDYALESSRMIYPESGAATNTPFFLFWKSVHPLSRQARDNHRENLEHKGVLCPSTGAAYGYLHWLNPLDPVDPTITNFGGAASQCVYVSRETRSVVVSMGQGTNSDCEGATDPRVMLPWAVVRDIVSAKKTTTTSGGSDNATIQQQQ